MIFVKLLVVWVVFVILFYVCFVGFIWIIKVFLNEVFMYVFSYVLIFGCCRGIVSYVEWIWICSIGLVFLIGLVSSGIIFCVSIILFGLNGCGKKINKKIKKNKKKLI